MVNTAPPEPDRPEAEQPLASTAPPFPCPVRVTTDRAWPLVNLANTRALEHAALQAAPSPSLMERAGAACARLAMALAPHSRRIWVACGLGNNGGDGAEAALRLHQAGMSVHVSTLPPNSSHPMPADATAAWDRLARAGIPVYHQPPPNWDLAIDALLGIGSRPGAGGLIAEWLTDMNRAQAPVLCLDTPSALDADRGHWTGPAQRSTAPRHTLSLLTLKPGLFTQEGKDWAGQVWWDSLGVPLPHRLISAELQGRPKEPVQSHARHKGNYGDVAIVGGDAGMEGAAWLAGSAALYAGAGRVWVSLLSPHQAQWSHLDVSAAGPQPRALMTRPPQAIDPEHTHVVCGCGGGQAVRQALPRLLSRAASLVLDADALNAVAQDSSLQTLLERRGHSGRPTVLTPHPLEAARLLGVTAHEIQSDRLEHARRLSDRYAATVVLKGSGTVVCEPGHLPSINPTGNARLATAGTGDVLAGMIGARLAQGETAWQAATQAVYWHGWAADEWPVDEPLIADRLAQFSRGRRTASGSP